VNNQQNNNRFQEWLEENQNIIGLNLRWWKLSNHSTIIIARRSKKRKDQKVEVGEKKHSRKPKRNGSISCKCGKIINKGWRLDEIILIMIYSLHKITKLMTFTSRQWLTISNWIILRHTFQQVPTYLPIWIPMKHYLLKRTNM